VAPLVVVPQRVAAEAQPRIVPDRVNVVGILLRVVVFEQQGWPVDSVIVRLTGIKRAGPGKMQVLDTGLAQPRKFDIGELAAQPYEVLLYQSDNSVATRFRSNS
jgi:hypothetical protein